MKKKLALMLALSLTVGTVLTGCGGSSDDAAQTSADSAQTEEESTEAEDSAAEEETEAADAADAAGSDLVYAVEAGSAGEAAAEENGFQTNVVASQADALMEVASGTSDAAIIDLLMAGAMIGEGTSYPNMKHTDELTTEEYGVGCRKGSDLASYINSVFAESYADGSMQETAATYGVQEALVEQPASEFTASAEDSDVAYIQEKGTMIVGITDFAPMDYKDDSGEWIGFDADMARIVAEKLGVEAQFVEIDWDNKIMELDSKNIDVVWNGMTLTSEVTSSMECTNPYCNNAQVIVVPN
ncbi:MAG: transporter substrate-binding domain-containing protein [Eubacterium sp.]|nr:transporter substrate-binding domain-containing protein [Eubacterium sp.]